MSHVHVIPTADARPHEHGDGSLTCWCEPTLQIPCPDLCYGDPWCWRCDGTERVTVSLAEAQADGAAVIVVHRCPACQTFPCGCDA